VALAAVHKLSAQACTDANTAVGDGTLTITVNGQISNINIDPADNTLADIRDAINKAPDNPGVQATIVSASDGARLIVTSTKTGMANGIKITTSGGNGGLAALTYDSAAQSNPMTELQAAADASITIDGFNITSDSNTVTGAIDGVTLNLLKAGGGTSTSLSISLDQESAKQAVAGFVGAYNAMVGTLAGLTRYDPEGGTTGALLGDSTVRVVKDSLRRNLTQPMPELSGSVTSLAEIGITTASNGFLELDDTKLSNALSTDFGAVGKIFASSNGVAIRLDNILESTLDNDGAIKVREDSLKSQLNNIQDQRDVLDLRMESVRKRLMAQFNAMDRLVAQLRNTGNFLTRQLAQLGTS